MSLDFLKELIPVFYNQHAVKVFERNVGFQLHWHDRMECILIKSGVLNVEIDKRNYVIPADNVVIIPPSILHGGEPGSPDMVYQTIMFDPLILLNNAPNVKQYFTDLSEKRVSLKPFTDNPEVIRLTKEIIELQNSKSSIDTLRVCALIYLLVAALFEHCVTEAQPRFAVKNTFLEIINYIQSNYAKPLTSSTLCQKFGYSQGYFSRRFIAETGMSPTAFIRTVRLENAALLLAETSTSIQEIAIQCGFKDTKYFNRCFRELYGITPSNYRDAAAGKGERPD